jgi:hypothetical protein
VGVDLEHDGGDVLLLAALERIEAHHAGRIAFTWATFGRHFSSSWISLRNFTSSMSECESVCRFHSM